MDIYGTRAEKSKTLSLEEETLDVGQESLSSGDPAVTPASGEMIT
jgi:hypothetical protein